MANRLTHRTIHAQIFILRLELSRTACRFSFSTFLGGTKVKSIDRQSFTVPLYAEIRFYGLGIVPLEFLKNID